MSALCKSLSPLATANMYRGQHLTLSVNLWHMAKQSSLKASFLEYSSWRLSSLQKGAFVICCRFPTRIP